MPVIPVADLRGYVADIFAAAGCSRAESARVAHYLVMANLTGHDSHGVARVPRYVSMKNDGAIFADRTLEVVVDTPSLSVVDGQFGFGQTVAEQATRIGIEKCRAHGLAAVALRNAGHIGRVGDWAEMAAAQGFISIHFCNAAGSVLVAPYNGVERRFSTAPFCIGVPRLGQAPLLLDFATSVVAEGKVLVASQGGKKVPPHAMIGPDGKQGNDPHLLYGDYTPTGPRNGALGAGALRAFGDYKGSALALMCELLGGALTGNGATSTGRRFANGLFSIFIDPARVDPAAFFDGELARYAAFVSSSKPMAADAEVLLPGEIEARTKAEREKNGVPLPDDTWNSIVETARALGIKSKPG